MTIVVEKLSNHIGVQINNFDCSKQLDVVEVKKIEQTLVNVIATKNPSSTVEKNSEEFRTELANQYEDGLTEEKYRKGSREITKRILVTNGLGDEYLKVKHDWGGLFYFKNGAPISMFTWDKETSIQKK